VIRRSVTYGLLVGLALSWSVSTPFSRLGLSARF